jgi:ribosomal protein S27AE
MIGFLFFLWFASAVALLVLIVLLVVAAIKRKPKKKLGVIAAADVVLCIALAVVVAVNAPPPADKSVSGDIATTQEEASTASSETPNTEAVAPSDTAPPPTTTPAATETPKQTTTPSATPSNTPTPTTPAPSTPTPRDNPLMAFDVAEYELMNGAGTAIIGLRGYVKIPRADFLSATLTEIASFIDTRYSTEREEDSGIVRIRGLDAPLCPKCGVLMSGYDTRLRRAVSGNGAAHSYRLRRLRCPSCGSIHLELPDFLRAGKHYEAAVIDEVLSGNSDSCSDTSCSAAICVICFSLK